MRRYDKIIQHLDGKRDKERRICSTGRCACRGCAGVVGGKKITQTELDMYLSGEMQRLAADHIN